MIFLWWNLRPEAVFFEFFCFFSTNGSEWRLVVSGKNDFTVLGRKEIKWQIPFLGFRVVKPERSLRWKFSCWMILSIFTGIFMISTKAFCTTTSSFQAAFYSYLFTSFIFNNRCVCKCIYIYIFVQYLYVFKTCFMTCCMPWSVIMKTQKVIHLLVQVAKQLSSVAFCGPLHPGWYELIWLQFLATFRWFFCRNS